MQELQALIQGKIPPQAINIEQLIVLAERYPKPMSAEYKLLELTSKDVFVLFRDNLPRQY